MKLRQSALILLLCLLVTRPASAAPRGPIAVILLPGTSLSDWQRASAPTLHRILATGAIAVMNTHTARTANSHMRETPESAALTLGAGSRAAGGGEVANFHAAEEVVPGQSYTYGDLYRRRTGIVPMPGEWVNPDWALALKENEDKGYDLLPGNLGDALRRHHIQVVCGGGRYAYAAACCSDGAIPDVSTRNTLPHPLPECLIWDAGSDLSVADKVLADAAAEVQRQHGALLVISPFANDRDYAAGRRLTPVALWGVDEPRGLIYSPSTHRAGLVTNTDFAPTIVALLGAKPGSSWLDSKPFGHVWEPRPSTNNLSQVTHLETAAYRQARGMSALPAMAIFLGFLLVGLLFTARRYSNNAFAWLPPTIVWALAISPDIGWAAAIAIAMGVAMRNVARRFSALHSVCCAAALIALTLAIDMLIGNRLMRWGLLGYSAVEGARYYGIGNEAMGPFIGAILVLAALLWPTRPVRRFAVAVVLVGLAALLGLPSAGAKAGGVLVAVAAFSVFLWTVWGRRLTSQTIAAVLALMICALAWIAWGDLGRHSAQQSHIGRGIERIKSGGLGEAVDIATRKLAVEARLLYHSAWAIPLWVSIAGFIVACRNPLAGRRRALLRGGIAAVVVCVAVNDAGVVAGALCGVVVVSGLIAAGALQNTRPKDDALPFGREPVERSRNAES